MGLAVVDAFAKFKKRRFIHSRNIEEGLKFQKGSRDPDHASFGGIFNPKMGLAVVDPLGKFKERNFINSRNTEGGLKFLKESRDPDHAPFRGNFYTCSGTCRSRTICQKY